MTNIKTAKADLLDLASIHCDDKALIDDIRRDPYLDRMIGAYFNAAADRSQAQLRRLSIIMTGSSDAAKLSQVRTILEKHR